MYPFHIDAAQLSPSQFHFVSFPFTFPAQTTVVIWGLYHAVQRSRGSMDLPFHFQLLTSLFDVPVLAATVRPFMVRAFLQKDDSGRELLFERIFVTI